MDRNGKKPKAARDEGAHPERSDTKAQTRDVLGRADANPRDGRTAAGGDAMRAKGARSGRQR